jgi:rRNA processing protein Gar1
MKRLGVVENLSYDGTVLVRSVFPPARGATIVDKRSRTIGTVVKVFGPVREPFASVRPRGPASPALLGAEVFVDEGKHADEKDRRGRRSH